MKRKITKIVLCLAGLFSTTGCLLERSNYIDNRAVDLIEVAHLDATSLGFGFLVNVGPVMIGGFENAFLNPGYRYMLGIGGLTENKDGNFDGSGLVLPFGYLGQDYDSSDPYKSFTPLMLSVGFDAGFFGGLGAHADLLEALDFVLGIFALDLLSDDEYDSDSYFYDNYRYDQMRKKETQD